MHNYTKQALKSILERTNSFVSMFNDQTSGVMKSIPAFTVLFSTLFISCNSQNKTMHPGDPVSGSVETHKNFIQNHQLPFTLLSDPDNKVLKLFGVKKKFFISGRETFVVDKSGKIVFTYGSFTNGPAHEREALAFIKTM